jgi:peptidoglycan/LPS O-acetylase OafA/YrhL
MSLSTASPATSLGTVRGPNGVFASSRIDQIDVLRGLSILAVIVHHINLRIPLSETPVARLLPKAVVNDLGWNGYDGVIIFFAISGFLITTTCLRRWKSLANISVGQFYRLRFARIVPTLLALLILLSTFHLLHIPKYTINPQQCSLPRALLSAATLHVNWLEAHRGYLPANWDVLWSLSNEEMFYLFFPLLCTLIRNRVALVSLLGAFVAVGPFARTVLTHNELWADYGYLSCMDAISIGCLAAIAADSVVPSRKNRIALLVLGISMIAFVTLFRTQVRSLGLYRTGLDVTVLATGTALALISFLQEKNPGSRLSAPLRWFGRNSYEVYLTHMMAIFALLPLVSVLDKEWRWAPLWYGIMVSMAGVLGGLVARYYSEPMNRMLRLRWR